MSFALRKAKRLHKKTIYYEHKVKKFEEYLSKIKKWHKHSIKEFNKHFKSLSKEDTYLFGLKEGYWEK